MATINLAGSTITYGFGSIIAMIVLILCIVFMAGGGTVTPFIVLCLIAGLALARLIP